MSGPLAPLLALVLLWPAINPAPAADTGGDAAHDPVVLPVGAGEAVTLPGGAKLWRQTEGPAVNPAELDGFTTWRLFAPGVYRFTVAPGATPTTELRAAAWSVPPGKTPALGDRRPTVALPAVADAQAGHPLQIVALRAHDDDGDPLTYRFRILKTDPAGLDCRLTTRDSADRAVLEAARPGAITVECRVHDGQLFSHPAQIQIAVGGRAPATGSAPAPANDTPDFTQPISLDVVNLSFAECMDHCAKRSRIPIVFQSGGTLKDLPLTLRVTELPLLRVLDLAARQTGAQYRLELLPGGDGAPDRTAVVWLSGWEHLRAEPLVAGEISLTDLAIVGDGRQLEARLTDIVREALAAQPNARCNLHGRDGDLGLAYYLPRSAHDRVLAAFKALNRPQQPQAAVTADSEQHALELLLRLTDLRLEAAATPLWQLLPTLSQATGRQWLADPAELAVGADAGSNPDAAASLCPVRPSGLNQPAVDCVADLLAQANAARNAVNPGAPPLQAVCWTPKCWLITADPPLPEFSDREPGPGQWLWQSAVVRAYDLRELLASGHFTGERIEHTIRSRFPAAFRDPGAHLSWWPEKKALLVIQRRQVQDAVSDALAALPAEAPVLQ